MTAPRPPETRRDSTVDVLHGQRVADPYRWLEDPDSDETRAWVSAQNQVSRAYLDGLASHRWLHETMLRIVRTPRAGTPAVEGGRYLVSRNDGTRQHDQLFVADSLEELREGGRLLVDPDTFSEDGTASLKTYDVSRDGRLLAYQVSEGGSDWTTVRLREVDTGEDLDDELTHVKFSGVTWLPDDRSFLYLRFPTAGEATGTDAEALPAGRLMRHVVGTPQSEDTLVWEEPDRPRVIPTPVLSHDGRWLVLHLAEGTSEKNRLWAYPVHGTDDGSRLGEPVRVVDQERAMLRLVRTDGDRLLLHTDQDAPRGRVVRVDVVEDPPLHDVVPEQDAALQAVVAAGDELVTVHLVDARPQVARYALDGAARGVVDLPGGAVVALDGEAGRDEVFVGMSSVTSRVTPYRLALPSGEVGTVTGLAPAGEAAWEPPEVHLERRRAVSRDGTEVPYFLVRRADVDLAEPRPTLLYGYGGFNIAVLADFRAAFAGWLTAGGVLAIANLRGGSEYGAAWHDAGRLEHKQHVFDDFAAVGDRLVADGVTTHDRLALHGGSNGGLLVAATMLQRPDLGAAVVPAVGVLDMLRFHRFTIGAAWISDYGSPDDPEMFEVLRAYSPLHNVEEGTAYPATLVLTGDHDDRVVPAHSFKFTAALQAAQGGDAPVLARIETAAGHGLGKPADVVAAETADLLAFVAEHTGLVPSEPPVS